MPAVLPKRTRAAGMLRGGVRRFRGVRSKVLSGCACRMLCGQAGAPVLREHTEASIQGPSLH